MKVLGSFDVDNATNDVVIHHVNMSLQMMKLHRAWISYRADQIHSVIWNVPCLSWPMYSVCCDRCDFAKL